MAESKIKLVLEVGDNGTLQLNTKNARELRKAIDEGTKASVLLSKGIADPAKKKALEEQVALAKQLTKEINATARESRSASKALASISGVGAVGAIERAPGLERGTAAANARGGSRDFARQAQGMGGLVHLYATFAANIWSVQAAYMALSSSFEQARMEKAAEAMSTTVGINMKGLAQSIREVSGYAVDFKESLQFGALGTQAGLTTKQITGLVTAAKGAANVLGRDVNDSINRMLRGTAKMEQEILDELGIFVRAKDAYKEYAKAQGYTSEAALTQTERVKAYAEAVEKASEKYKQFAAVEDPFSKLGATIKDSGRDLLNIANTVITPFISSLAESGNLVQGLIVAGAAYLTKLAVPAIKSFKESLTDTSRLQREAVTANANKLVELEHQLEESKTRMFAVPKGIKDNLSRGFGTAIDASKIGEKVQTALLSATDSESFRTKLQASFNKSAWGKTQAATRAEKAGNTEKAAALRAEADLIKMQGAALSDRLSKDTRINELIEKRARTTQEQLELERLIEKAKENQLTLNTKAQQALISQEKKNAAASSTKTMLMSLPGLIGVGTEKPGEAWAGMKEAYASLYEGTTKTQKVFRTLGVATQLLSGGLDILMKAVSRVFMIMLAWDLAIAPLLKHFGLITDKTEEASKAIEAFSGDIDTANGTLKTHSMTVQNHSGDLDLLIKSYSAVANSVTEMSDSILASISDTSGAMAGMTILDTFMDKIKGLFGYGLGDKLDEQNSKLKNYLITLGSSPKLVDDLSAAQEKLAAANEEVERTKYIFDTSSRGGKAENEKSLNLAIDLQIKASQNLLDKQKLITDEFLKQKAAATETAAVLQGFKSIELAGNVADALTNYDPKAYRFKNTDLKSAQQGIDSITGKIERFQNLSKGDSKDNLMSKLSAPERAGVINGLATALGSLDDSLILLKARINDEKFITLYERFIRATKEAKASGSMGDLKTAAQELLGYMATLDKADIERQKSESQMEAYRTKLLNEQDRIRKELAEWNKDSLARDLASQKEELTLIQAKNKLLQDTELFQTKEALSKEEITKRIIIQSEQEVELAKLKAKWESDAKVRRTMTKAEQQALLDIYNTQVSTIEKQTDIKLEIANIEDTLAKKARDRLEYEKTINAEISRGLSLAGSRLEAAKARGTISEATYDEGKFNQAILKIQQERLSAYNRAGILNAEQQPAAVAANPVLQEKLKELDVAEQSLKTEKDTTDILRTRKEILEGLTNTENLMGSILDKQQARGLYNLNLEQQLTDTKIARINKEIEYADKDYLKIQTLELQKQNTLYEAQLKMHEAMKRNFLELTPGQMTQTVVNEAQIQVDKFKASMKDSVTGVFDAVYSGMDAAIDELTTKWMNSEEISFKDLVTTFRNTAAEEFRKMSADQLKLGARELISKGIGAITGTAPDLRSVEEQQLSVLQQIANNTSMMVSGTSSGTGFSTGYSNAPDTSEMSIEEATRANEAYYGALEQATDSTNELTNKVPGFMEKIGISFGGIFGTDGLVMGLIRKLGEGIGGILGPILNLFGISGVGSATTGFGGGSLGGFDLGSLGSLFSGDSIGSAIGSAMGMEGFGGWLSGLFFANGGIMTDRGALSLNRYATGGIANSPQLAMYGEGRQPEAYVPLPDGRTIPVTMQNNSGGAVNVNINITDNSTTSDVSASGEGKDYAAMAKIISGKVREELINQKRPGGILY